MVAPLGGVRVAVRADGVAAAYAARLLATLGAACTLIEPPGGSRLRSEPPLIPGTSTSTLFAYLFAGIEARTMDLSNPGGRVAFNEVLETSDAFIDDTPVANRMALGLDPTQVATAHPRLIHASALPFGATGPKADWKGEEINALHASGEGYLLPNGLANELFPERPPVKVHGHFTEMQGGVATALGVLAALWARETTGGQFVDVASQDAGLAVGAFAIQRLGDGFVEQRAGRSFRYGGVIECADGFIELLTLEQRQWDGLVDLLGQPDWALDPAFEDSLERSRRGGEINRHIREWARTRSVDEVVNEGQKRSVPIAKYYSPEEILTDGHEQFRGLFQPVDVPGAGELPVLVSPFHLDGRPLQLRCGPPNLSEAEAAGTVA